MIVDKGFTYSDVLIIPDFSDIPTRDDIDIRIKILGEYRLPIFSAPMNTVSGPEMVNALHNKGAYGILHRFGQADNLTEDVSKARALNPTSQFGVSVGIRDWDRTKDWLDSIKENNIHSICIDVAHGHHILVAETIQKIREWSGEIYIIAGNVATANGYTFLAKAGADAVRVGIGPGSDCTTRENTGVGFPQLSAIEACSWAKKNYSLVTSIIADGGIQYPGDIPKALGFGADAVMLGKMLAGADEAPGTLLEGMKQYTGQSMYGSNGNRGAPEGISGYTPTSGPVADTIDQLEHYIKSAFSYIGARTLEEFRESVTFVRVSPGTHQESKTRL